MPVGFESTRYWKIILFTGEEQTAEDAEDGPPELLFIHGGHTAKISGNISFSSIQKDFLEINKIFFA
jgi:hypothetical protein